MTLTNAIDDVTINIASSKKSQQGNVIKLAYQPQVIFIEADKARITQVISNLLNNAVKFTEVKVNEGVREGEGRAIININTEKVDDVQAIVSIRDTGTGIDLKYCLGYLKSLQRNLIKELDLDYSYQRT